MEKRFHPKWKLLFGLLTIISMSLQAAEQVQRVFPVSKNPTVSVLNYSGVTSVKGWQMPQVKAVCTKYSQNVRIDTNSNGNSVGISTHVLDRLASPENVKVDCQILTPEESNMEIRSNLGEVTVENIRGDMIIDVVNAQVRVAGVTGRIDAKSLGSKLEIAKSKGTIRTNTVSGDIALSHLDSDSVTASSTLGDIVYEGLFLNGGKYNFSSNEGAITIQCTHDPSARWDARTFKGNIENNLPTKLEAVRSSLRAGPGKQFLLGTTHSGKATVQLSTFSGRIQINHK